MPSRWTHGLVFQLPDLRVDLADDFQRLGIRPGDEAAEGQVSIPHFAILADLIGVALCIQALDDADRRESWPTARGASG